MIYLILRYYPFCGFPLAFLCGELGWMHKRKGHASQYFFWLFMVLFLVSSLLWCIFRGDLHSDQWIKELSLF